MKVISPLNRRFLGMAGTILRSNISCPRLPYRLLLFLTNRCNCQCHTCSIWKQPPSSELELSEVTRILENATDYLRWLHLSGGEIFLRPDIAEIFAKTAELRALCLLQFVTNCTLPDRVLNCAEIAASSPIPRVVVTLSLDGVEEEHDRLRGVPGLFQKVIALYHEIKTGFNGRVSPFLGLTVSAHNQSRLPEIFRVLQSAYGVPARDVHINFFHYAPDYYHNKPTRGRSLEADAAAAEISRKQTPFFFRLTPSGLLEARYRGFFRAFVETGKTPLSCEAFRGSMVVTAGGECQACAMFSQSAAEISAWGYDIGEFWSSLERKSARRAIEAGKCPQCWTPCEAFPTLLAHLLPFRRGVNK